MHCTLTTTLPNGTRQVLIGGAVAPPTGGHAACPAHLANEFVPCLCQLVQFLLEGANLLLCLHTVGVLLDDACQRVILLTVPSDLNCTLELLASRAYVVLALTNALFCSDRNTPLTTPACTHSHNHTDTVNTCTAVPMSTLRAL